VNCSHLQKRELPGKYLLLLARYVYQALRAVPALTMNIIPYRICYFKLYSAIHLPLVEEGDFSLDIVKLILHVSPVH
jgi:hypothetical protein